MKVTAHPMMNTPYAFCIRPSIALVGQVGDCLSLEVPEGKGLAVMTAILDPTNTLAILDVWDENPGIAVVNHPQASRWGGRLDVRHNLTPQVQQGSPSRYEPVEELAILGGTDGILILHDVGHTSGVTNYLENHERYEPLSLEQQARRRYIFAALEAAILTVPFELSAQTIVNIFTAGISFYDTFPELVKWVAQRDGKYTFPLWTGDGSLKEPYENLEAYLKERSGEFQGKRMGGVPTAGEPTILSPTLQAQLKDIMERQGEDDGPVS